MWISSLSTECHLTHTRTLNEAAALTLVKGQPPDLLPVYIAPAWAAITNPGRFLAQAVEKPF